MSMINVADLTFAYDGSYDYIFENVSFQLDTDWKLGFTGRNGRGKTTFLNLLMGRYEYRGKVTACVEFDYFPFPVRDKENLTLDVILGIDSGLELWRLKRELSNLKVEEETLYRPFSTLSNGEQTKVLLAALFLRENHFLLIDEPTNHLDVEARRTVGDYLKSKKGFLLVSHDRDFLDRCVDHILSINKTNIEIQKGNFSSWYENKRRQDEFERAENDRLKKDIGRLTAAARSTKKWAEKAEATKIGRKSREVEHNTENRDYIGEQSRRMQQRRKNLERRMQGEIHEKSKLLKNIEDVENLKLNLLRFHTDRLVTLEDVSVCYGDRSVCRDVNFAIMQGDRISLQGKNGCGKSSIVKLILGEDIPHDGRVKSASGLIISYVSQDTSFLRGGLLEYARRWNVDESLFLAVLRKLDFSRGQFDKDMERFSEGQKKKVLIARSLCEKAHLFIWDEPLNFIDVFSRMQIEELLLTYKPTMLFVEHDRVFSEKVATKILVMDREES